jgi:hypothetical protein
VGEADAVEVEEEEEEEEEEVSGRRSSRRSSRGSAKAAPKKVAPKKRKSSRKSAGKRKTPPKKKQKKTIVRRVTKTVKRTIKRMVPKPKEKKPEPVLSPEEHSKRERERLRAEMLTGANLSMHAAFEAKTPKIYRELKVADGSADHPMDGYDNTPVNRPARPQITSNLSAADRQLLSDAAAAAGLRTASAPIRRSTKPFKFEGPLEGGAKLPMGFIDHMLQRNARCVLEQRNPKKEGTKVRASDSVLIACPFAAFSLLFRSFFRC